MSRDIGPERLKASDEGFEERACRVHASEVFQIILK
jgi:hypothetical protein